MEMDSAENITVNTKAIQVLDPYYGGWLGRSPWTLCVGAGISVGIAPSWEVLAWKVYQQCFENSISDFFLADGEISSP